MKMYMEHEYNNIIEERKEPERELEEEEEEEEEQKEEQPVQHKH